MNLYLNAESNNKIGYIPDWLKISYENFELTLDIQGDIDHENDCLNCRCKGDLIPWVLYNNESGNEINLYDLSTKEVNEVYPVNRIAEILQKGTNFRIGVYPVDDREENMKLAEEDVLSNCSGLLVLGMSGDSTTEFRINFDFEVEHIG